MAEGPEATPSRILEPAELDDLLAQHLELLRYYVRLRAGPLLRSREPISDIVQSTLRELLHERATFQYSTEAAFRRWLYQVATHKIISKNRYHLAQMRDAAREEVLESRLWDVPQQGSSSPSASPSRHAAHVEDLEQLERAFDELDEEDRQIVAMKKVFDLPSNEIGKALDMPESTVRWRLARAMAKLASKLE
jgi:RNA polymerase sigma-70 factor, ECF subfamily